MAELPDVLFLDCQAAGATPAHGDLLELAWAVGGGEITTRNVLPARPVSPIVRKLTGWSEKRIEGSIDAMTAWRELVEQLGSTPFPTVIHYSRFELPFLRDLHARAGGTVAFPLDIVCLHAIAARLYPDLARRNLRALSGYLGHSPDMLRRASGHVEATAFVWNAFLPKLRAMGGWDDVKAWLAEPRIAPRRGTKRTFPLATEKRRSLPDRPGIYRFHRSNGDVLYVGKAASLRKRVAGHFVAAQRGTERALEMLTQAHEVTFETTGTALEAALLETDEIKRIDPPYNVHLREHERAPSFASRDWKVTVPVPDAEHPLGPLPSAQAIAGIAAIRRILEGAPLDDALRAAALGVTERWAPPASMLDPVLTAFVARELAGSGSARTRLVAAGARLSSPDPDPSTDGWNPERIERALVRTVVEEIRILQRARALALLADCQISFREPSDATTRSLVVAGATVVAEDTVSAPRPRLARLVSTANAASYDRLRVLFTELSRIRREGGDVAVRIGRHGTLCRGASALVSPRLS